MKIYIALFIILGTFFSLPTYLSPAHAGVSEDTLRKWSIGHKHTNFKNGDFEQTLLSMKNGYFSSFSFAAWIRFKEMANFLLSCTSQSNSSGTLPPDEFQTLLSKEHTEIIRRIPHVSYNNWESLRNTIAGFDENIAKRRVFFLLSSKEPYGWKHFIKTINSVSPGQLDQRLCDKLMNCEPQQLSTINNLTPDFFTRDMNPQQRGIIIEELIHIYSFTVEASEDRVFAFKTYALPQMSDGLNTPQPIYIRTREFILPQVCTLSQLGFPYPALRLISTFLQHSCFTEFRSIIRNHFSSDSASERVNRMYSLSGKWFGCAVSGSIMMNRLAFENDLVIAPPLKAALDICFDSSGSDESYLLMEGKNRILEHLLNLPVSALSLVILLISEKEKLNSPWCTWNKRTILNSLLKIPPERLTANFVEEIRTLFTHVLPSNVFENLEFLLNTGSFSNSEESLTKVDRYAQDFRNRTGLSFPNIDIFNKFFEIIDSFSSHLKAVEFLNKLVTLFTHVLPSNVFENLEFLLNTGSFSNSEESLTRVDHYAQDFRNRTGLSFPNIDIFNKFFEIIDSFSSHLKTVEFLNKLVFNVRSYFSCTTDLDPISFMSESFRYTSTYISKETLSDIIENTINIEELESRLESSVHFEIGVEDLLISGDPEDLLTDDGFILCNPNKRKSLDLIDPEERGSVSHTEKRRRTDSAFTLPPSRPEENPDDFDLD